MLAEPASSFSKSYGAKRYPYMTTLDKRGNIFTGNPNHLHLHNLQFTMFAKRASSFIKSRGVKRYCHVTTSDRGGKIFTLTIKGDGDQPLLTPDLMKSFLSELDEVKSKATNGSVLITTAEGKNFCTGFPRDGYQYHEVINLFGEVVKHLISLPMPTIAAINGCAISAGLILAMSHDHLAMESKHSLLSMTDLDNKMHLPDYFTAMIRSKVVPGAFSRLALNTLPLNSKHAEQMGLSVHTNRETSWDTAVGLAFELSGKNWDGNVYAGIRKTLYPDLCNVLGLSCAPSSLP